MKNAFSRIATMAATSAVLSVPIVLDFSNPVQAVTFNFNFQGENGYSAVGQFSYDETTAPGIISESGSGPTNDLESLSVSFFDPSNNLLQSFDTVSGGVSNSSFFEFNFDTATQTLFGDFNVGGGTGVIGELFFSGTVGSSFELRQDVDQAGTSILLDENAGTITVTPTATGTPEPASILGLLAVGALAKGLTRKKA